MALYDRIANVARLIAGFRKPCAGSRTTLSRDRHPTVNTAPNPEPPVSSTLDVRFLEPPEPFERIAAALEGLKVGEALRVLIHREPRPLFRWLSDDGFRHRSGWIDEGAAYEIVIWR